MNKGLKWNKARLKCLSKLVFSIIKNRTVNLSLAAASMTNETQKESEYRKAQRFFKDFEMPILEIGALFLNSLPKPKEGWVLSMDRTNWKFGSVHINLLVVGVVVQGISIPLVWHALPQETKNGNSKTHHRITLIEDLLKLMPAEDIYALTMDREFIGKKWLSWLNEQNVSYIARIKKNHRVNNLAVEEWRKLRSREKQGEVSIWDMNVFIGVKAIQRGRDKHLFVISNKIQGKEAIKIYKKRWSIEQLFSHLKKKGFNLEDTHITASHKVERLFGVVAISFYCTFQWGRYLSQEIKLNAHEKRKSLFRLGLESLLEIFSEGIDNVMKKLELRKKKAPLDIENTLNSLKCCSVKNVV